jgi:hypothetical protein
LLKKNIIEVKGKDRVREIAPLITRDRVVIFGLTKKTESFRFPLLARLFVRMSKLSRKPLLVKEAYRLVIAAARPYIARRGCPKIEHDSRTELRSGGYGVIIYEPPLIPFRPVRTVYF